MGYCPESCHGEADQGQAGAAELYFMLGKCCIQLLVPLTRSLHDMLQF